MTALSRLLNLQQIATNNREAQELAAAIEVNGNVEVKITGTDNSGRPIGRTDNGGIFTLENPSSEFILEGTSVQATTSSGGIGQVNLGGSGGTSTGDNQGTTKKIFRERIGPPVPNQDVGSNSQPFWVDGPRVSGYGIGADLFAWFQGYWVNLCGPRILRDESGSDEPPGAEAASFLRNGDLWVSATQERIAVWDAVNSAWQEFTPGGSSTYNGAQVYIPGFGATPPTTVDFDSANSEVWDTHNYFNAATPTRATLPATGRYMVQTEALYQFYNNAFPGSSVQWYTVLRRFDSSDNFIEVFERHITLAGEAGNSTQKKDSIYNFAANAGDYLTLELTVSGQAPGYVPAYSQFRFTVEYRG